MRRCKALIVHPFAAFCVGIVFASTVGVIFFDCICDVSPAADSSAAHLCNLSRAETGDLICAADEVWNYQKHIIEHQLSRFDSKTKGCRAFLQANHEPAMACVMQQRIGAVGDGGKWVCNPVRLMSKASPCKIVSIGSNNDFSFEEGMYAFFGDKCEIHTFDHTVMDPTPPSFVHYHSLGLGPSDRNDVRTLSTLLKQVSTADEIEILKIDIEGAEYDTLIPHLRSSISSQHLPRQLLIELHADDDNLDDVEKMDLLLKELQKRHYVIFAKEPNIQWSFKAEYDGTMMLSLSEACMLTAAQGSLCVQLSSLCYELTRDL